MYRIQNALKNYELEELKLEVDNMISTRAYHKETRKKISRICGFYNEVNDYLKKNLK